VKGNGSIVTTILHVASLETLDSASRRQVLVDVDELSRVRISRRGWLRWKVARRTPFRNRRLWIRQLWEGMCQRLIVIRNVLAEAWSLVSRAVR
jgi:hypothetical protein